MSFIDSLVLVFYFIAVVGVGIRFSRGDKNSDDYFLGGRRQPWLIVGLSILATELSALTFIAVPGKAFAGDCGYLQLYFGAFCGRMLIVWLLLPVFYQSRVTTVYEYLGQRFGTRTRLTASAFFLASRLIGSALRLLAASVAIHIVFGWPLVWVIVGCAAVAVGYATFGGIKAIIWTDALQAVVFLAAATAVLVFLFAATPGTVTANLQTALDAGKFKVFDFRFELNNDHTFWVLLVHALFLNAAVFGTDQDLTQRMLTCSDVRGGQRSLTFSTLAGLPVVTLFLLIGVMMWVFYDANGHQAPDQGLSSDRVFPHFIATALPSGWGLRGLLAAGLFAAAMSSLDSALGALSSTAVVDLYRPLFAPNRDAGHYVRAGRIFVVVFGMVLVVIAISFARERDLLYEAFKWAGLIFGPMLGVFMLAVLTKNRGNDRFNPVAMVTGLVGLIVLKYVQSEDNPLIAWPWWVVIGTLWTFGFGVLFSSGRVRRDTALV